MRKSSFLLNIPLPKFTLFFCEMHPSLNICEMHPSLNICEMHPVTQHLWNTFLTQHLWNAPLTQHLRNAPPSLNICEAHIDWNEKRKLLIRQLCGYQAHGLYCTLYVLCTLKQAVGLWWGVPVVAHYIPPPKKK